MKAVVILDVVALFCLVVPGAAPQCLQNPTNEESGSTSRRQSYYITGSGDGLLDINAYTYVRDAIGEICLRLGITDAAETEEYSLFVPSNDLLIRLNHDEYLVCELSRFGRVNDIVFQRTVWFYPLRLSGNELYVQMMYAQALPDYHDGSLVVLTGPPDANFAAELALLGALQHRATGRVTSPLPEDLPRLLPGIARSWREISDQYWLNLIDEQFSSVPSDSSLHAKTRFLEILSNWPLFGSTFFHVTIAESPVFGECLLAVNKYGINFLNQVTHETILSYPFSGILSTRPYRSDSNVNFLDIKVGNLMVQKILPIETDQETILSYPFSGILSTRPYRSDSNVSFLDIKVGNLMVQKILPIETDQGADIADRIGQYRRVIDRRP